MASTDRLRDLQHRLLMTGGARLLWTLERVIAHFSLVGNPPIFDPQQFPWARHLEANWETIRRELDGVLVDRENLPNFQDISEDQKLITDDNHWKTFFLYGFGYKAEANCERCPETTRLVESIPGMKTAFFSILSPHKHIKDHRGPYKGLLRYHLGLKVPEPKEQCRIRIHDQFRHWEEGQSLIFDDTYNHEVWNDTEGERVVLFVDVLRPLPPLVAWLNEQIVSLVARTSYIQNARRNFQDWEQRLERLRPTERAEPPVAA